MSETFPFSAKLEQHQLKEAMLHLHVDLALAKSNGVTQETLLRPQNRAFYPAL